MFSLGTPRRVMASYVPEKTGADWHRARAQTSIVSKNKLKTTSMQIQNAIFSGKIAVSENWIRSKNGLKRSWFRKYVIKTHLKNSFRFFIV